MKLKGWNLYEVLWLMVFSTVAVVLTVIKKDTLIGFSVFITGVLCVILAAKGSLWNYIFGMYNSLTYAFLAYNNGLFGEVGLNLLFYAPMNIIGFAAWKRRMIENTVEMRGLNNKGKMLTAIGCISGTVILGFILSLIPGQNTPYIDASTNVFAVIATFLMVWRYKEQWLLYIILNVLTIIMWTIRAAAGSTDGIMMIVLWSAYLINAIYGYYNWNKGSKKSEAVRTI